MSLYQCMYVLWTRHNIGELMETIDKISGTSQVPPMNRLISLLHRLVYSCMSTNEDWFIILTQRLALCNLMKQKKHFKY